MAQYYAVERSSEYLAHYGVRGMRWGVHRAIASGNTKRLDRQYKKAQKKLSKLNKNADIVEQRKQQVKYAKRAAIGLGISAIGTGGVLGAHALRKTVSNNYNKTIGDLMYKAYKHGRPGDAKSVESFVAHNPVAQKHWGAYQNKARALNDAKKVSAAVDLAGLGYGGYAGTRSLIAKYRQTQKGHIAAVAKRNKFQSEMNKAFAGTKYGKKRRK